MFSVKIISPVEVFFNSSEVRYLKCCGEDGEFGVLSKHCQMLEIIFKVVIEENQQKHFYSFKEGVLNIDKSGNVIILINTLHKQE